MPKHAVVTTDEEIEAALHTANLRKDEVKARVVEHIPELNLLIIGLSNQRRLVLPVEDLQGLESATHEQLVKYDLLGDGTGLRFPELDADFYIPGSEQGCLWNAPLDGGGGAEGRSTANGGKAKSGPQQRREGWAAEEVGARESHAANANIEAVFRTGHKSTGGYTSRGGAVREPGT